MDREEEFRWLFATEYQSVVRAIYVVLRDRARAEEIAQDAFVQLLRNWRKVRDYDSPPAWVRRVAMRLAAKDARRERLGSLLTRRAAAARTPSAEAEPASDAELREAIGRLPAQQRAVVVLFYYEDRPMDEIAQIIGCSPSTGWVHLHRARKRLGALLAQEVSDDVR